MTAPAASPNHHVSHTSAVSASGAMPARVRLNTPIVALTVVLKNPPRTMRSFTIPAALANARLPPAKRSMSVTATMASRPLPAATASELATEPAVVTLARNAPANTAGSSRKPPSNNAAIAMPVGNHTAEALG